MIHLLYFSLFLLHQGTSAAQGMEGRGFAWDEFWRRAFAPVGSTATLVIYYASLAALFACYARLIRGPATRAHRVLGVATVLLLAATPASRSTDVYAYLAHGHNGAPDLKLAHAREIYPAPSTPYLDELGSRTGLVGHGPTPYGPLWTHLEVLAFKASGGKVYVGSLLLKALGAVCLLVSAGLAAAMAGPLAASALLLNPFLLTELVAEGHNDGLMLLLCLAGFYFLKRARLSTAVAAAGAAVLTKYVPVLLIGPFIRYLIARKKPFLVALAGGFVLSVVAAWLLYYPLWIGAATFQGVRDNSGEYPAFVRLSLKDTFKAYPLAGAIFRGGLWVLFLSFWAGVSSRAKSFEACVLAGALVLLGYLLFFPPFVWPWYLTLPVALLLLLPPEKFLPWALLFSVNGSIAGPVWGIYKNGIITRATANYLQHGFTPGLSIFIFAGLVAVSLRAPLTKDHQVQDA